MITLKSEIDSSVNFVWDCGSRGEAIEARYVRRDEDYLACYLSSQTACAKACRMCHLTQTKQNKATDLSIDQIEEQAKAVLNYYSDQPRAKVVHFNFMARGEPLDSTPLKTHSPSLFSKLTTLARDNGLLPRILISTIMPTDLQRSLIDIFPAYLPDIYYSIYSVDPKFRKRWLPNAMPVEQALNMLAEWQRHTKKIPRLHWALIKGENDDIGNAYAICNAVDAAGLRADISLVHYNPYSPDQGEEAVFAYQKTEDYLKARWPHSRIKTITRVGEDVAASCGMFINLDQI